MPLRRLARAAIDRAKPFARAVKFGRLYRKALRDAAKSGPDAIGASLPPVAFFFGCGRSGTTILGTIFAEHPQIRYLFEPYHLWAAIDPRSDMLGLYVPDSSFDSGTGVPPVKDSSGTGVPPVTAEAGSTPASAVRTHTGTPPHCDRRHCLMSADMATDDIRRRFHRLIRARPAPPAHLVVEKTPINALRIGLLDALAPDAKFVHIARDGVDVCRSIERIATRHTYRIAGKPDLNPWWGIADVKWQTLARDGRAAGYYADEVDSLRDSTQKGAYEWLLSLREVARWRERLGPRLFEFTYEELTANPRASIVRLCEFLDVDVENAWLERSTRLVEEARRNDRAAIVLPPAMAEDFNRFQARYGFTGRAHSPLPPVAESPLETRGAGGEGGQRDISEAKWPLTRPGSTELTEVSPRGRGLRREGPAMKIAHYLARFRLADGGVMRAVIDLCGALAQRGHDISIITADASDLPLEWKGAARAGLPRVVLMERPPRGIGGASRRIIDEALDRAGPCDALHLHTPWDPANMQFARAALRRNTPYLLSVHGMLDDWSMAQKSLKKRLFLVLGARGMLERAATVHCTAAAELDQARKWFPHGRGAVVPLIFDCSEYATLPGPAPARAAIESAGADLPVILFLSRLHPKKRPEILIDAAGVLRDEGRQFRVILAGSGDAEYERALRERVHAAGLGDAVHFAGLVTGLAKVSLFDLARVFVLPTSQENFGFVYLESLAAGTPVMTTRGTDTWRELEESGGAVIVERDDAETFAREIAALLDDPTRAESMGAAGRKWVFDHFAGDAVVREFESMYERAAAHHIT